MATINIPIIVFNSGITGLGDRPSSSLTSWLVVIQLPKTYLLHLLKWKGVVVKIRPHFALTNKCSLEDFH